MNKKRKIALWCIVAVWMAVIFMFSAQKGETSSKLSGAITESFITAANSSDETVDKLSDENYFLKIERFVRKTAHLLVYIVLGGLLLTVLLCYRLKQSLRMLIAFLLSVLYAASDEFHQMFVSARHASITDVAIDSLGALIGILAVSVAYWAICFYRTRKSK